MDLQLLQFIVDGGSSAFLIYLILRLLTRLDTITDRILASQEQASAERQVIAREVGLSTQDLRAAAAEVRYRKNSNSKLP